MKLALIGWGAIGRSVGTMLAQDPVDIVAVAVRDTSIARPDLPPGAALVADPRELAAIGADVVAEAAGRDSVEPWGSAALESGADLIVSSVSAFADAELLESMRALAVANQVQLQIQPGALAGVDALAAAKEMGIETVEHRMIKPPRAWLGTPAESLCDLEGIDAPTAFFSASAAETASQFPKNANVAMTTALAGIGPNETQITLVADPTASTNRHEINASGPFGDMNVVIANNPLPDNPKTSAMAALALVRAIRNRVNAIVI